MIGIDICEQTVELSIDIPRLEGNPMVFIGKIMLSPADLGRFVTRKERELYLFGGKVVDGFHPKHGELFQVRYVAVEKDAANNQLIEHQLAQHNSILFKEKENVTSSKSVEALKMTDLAGGETMPVWNSQTAVWPFLGGKPFLFLRQIYIPDNQTNQKFFTFDKTVFLFGYVTDHDTLLVQVFNQDNTALSTEGRYWLEMQIAEFERHYQDIVIVEKLIRKSDKFFHEYLLESNKANNEVMLLLAKYGKTRTIIERASKRIR